MYDAMRNGNGNGRGWSPVRYVPPPVTFSDRRPVLGEVAPAAVLESPLLSLGTDIVAVGASAYLAYGLSAEAAAQGRTTGWSTFWWIAAAAVGVKALHDLARLNA